MPPFFLYYTVLKLPNMCKSRALRACDEFNNHINIFKTFFHTLSLFLSSTGVQLFSGSGSIQCWPPIISISPASLLQFLLLMISLEFFFLGFSLGHVSGIPSSAFLANSARTVCSQMCLSSILWFVVFCSVC